MFFYILNSSKKRCSSSHHITTSDAGQSWQTSVVWQPIPLGVTFSKALSKLKAQSSNLNVIFHWNVGKETFELWALNFETAFENVTPSGIGCTSKLARLTAAKKRIWARQTREASMMIIAFITWNSNLVPLIEGLCNSNSYRFEFLVLCGIKPTTLGLTVPRSDQLSYVDSSGSQMTLLCVAYPRCI